MLGIYRFVLNAFGARPLHALLRRRLARGKEDAARLNERMGQASQPRPAGKLIWLHAASVGEAQSLLSLIDALLATTDASILMTTGTVNSAKLMGRRLPARAIHQFYPIDHPRWVAAFLDHWRPDLALWAESELWPMMLGELSRRKIPAALINGSLSPKAFAQWRRLPRTIRTILAPFKIILAQTPEDAAHFTKLGARAVQVTGNLKYSAAPLIADTTTLATLQKATQARPLWLYASTHAGEETLAARVHKNLSAKFPNLLTIIVPRHPERRGDILATLKDVRVIVRGADGNLPSPDTDIYLADTLGELGLFYRLAPVACIGRSFSDDGGGGHNPIEPAQLGCAVLHGPNVQNEAPIYDAMDSAGASLRLIDEQDFAAQLARLLADPAALKTLQEAGHAFVIERATVLTTVMQSLQPLLIQANIPCR